MTQQTLANAIGVSRGRIPQLEGGEPWTLAQLDAAAGAMGCNAVELIGGIVVTDRERALLVAVRSGDYKALMEAAVAAMKGG